MRAYLTQKNYLKLLAIFYFIGFGLHVFDLLGLRLHFASMSTVWKMWIVYLTVLDFLTAALLLRRPILGIILFHTVALSQLYAYLVHEDFFGRQDFLVIFHVLTLTIYWKMTAKEKRLQREHTTPPLEQHTPPD